MANKFLENLTEEKDDLKDIKNTLNKIYDIEVKEEKREELTQKRKEQKEKRLKGDKKFNIKEILGVTKKDEKKAKNGLLGMLGGVFKGIFAIGAKPLLALAGIGLIGGAITAYIKSEKFREGVNDYVFKPLMELISTQLPEIMKSAVQGILQRFNIVGNPDGASNPQEETSGTTVVRETGEVIERFFGRQKISNKTRESRAIRQSMRYQDHHYGQGLLLPGGIDEVDRKLQNFYRKGQTQIDSHLHLLAQMDNMDIQLQKFKKAVINKDENHPTYEKYTKHIMDLEANLAIKTNQIVESEKKLKHLAKEEAELKKYERDAMGTSHLVHPPAFYGSNFVKKQTGGILEPKDFTKKRPGNGPPSEDKIAEGMVPLHRQRGGKVFLHWAASGYSGAHPNYHATIQGDGSVSKTRDYNTFGGAHTYGYNSQGIGISLAAMAGASPDNFGSYPVKPIQYENMAKLTASILTDWGHNSSYVNDKTVATHAEAGRDNPGDNYGPRAWGGDGNKWDLWKLYENDEVGTGGPKIRSMVKAFMGGNHDMDEITTEKGGGTNTNTGAGTTLTQNEHRELQKTVKQTRNPIDMLSGMGNTLGKLGGPLGQFVEGAISKVTSSFQGSLVAKKQSGGFVGNHKVAYDGLKKRFPEAQPHHLVGAMANFETEAPGIKPDIYQLRGGPGRGIAQWEVPHSGNPTGRWAKAEQMYGKDAIKSLPKQLDFVKWEMDTGHPLPDGRPNLPWGRNAKKEWLSSKTTAEATKNFLEGYEAPSIPHMDRRLANAKKFNNQAAIEESRKTGSESKTGKTSKKTDKKFFGLFQNGGVVGMSQDYHLNNLMEQMNTGPIMVPIPVSAARTGVSTPGGGVGPSSSGTSYNDSYRISMGAAYS